MDWIQYIDLATRSIAGVALAIGGYFLYKRKHPIEVKAEEAQIERIKIENQELIAKQMKSHVDWSRAMIEKERVECDEKIEALKKEMQLMQDTLARNSRDIEVAMRMCNNDCFRKSA
jgi:hypothetical protein